MNAVPARIGISAIATHQPSWTLGNDWFAGTIARKFVHHTGIESRQISQEDEVTMAVRAVKNLQREAGCNLADCAAVVFASPSFVPLPVARKLLPEAAVREERLQRAARRLVRRLGIAECPAVGLNWFCSGYSKALEIANSRLLPRLTLQDDQFLLVVTASRISRITDYSCQQTAALFGDMATATLLSPTTSQKHPVHFELLHAAARKQPAEGVFFNFHLRDDVLSPSEGGGRHRDARRLVFSLDGMGIADVAPRAMASAVQDALAASGIGVGDVQFVVPHQAGTGIVRFTGMKVEQIGVRGEVINGHTSQVGNVSSCSIPYALKQDWQRLTGTIACPTAAVGDPGKAEVSQGCILLRSTPWHQRLARTAA